MANERVNLRNVTENVDTPIVGAFGGLSESTASTTGGITDAQKLTNAYVNKNNEIVRRSGSVISTVVQNLSLVAANTVNAHYFTYDSIPYCLTREGLNLRLNLLDANGVLLDSRLKTNAFIRITNDPTTFTTIIDNSGCFVLCSTSSTNMVILYIGTRSVNVRTIATPTTPVIYIDRYPITNVITQNNTLLFDSTNVNIPIVSVNQAAFQLDFVTAAPTTLVVGSTVKCHLIFMLFSIPATYYPGSFLYNTAIRNNNVAADVNVAVPTDLADNPIINEPVPQKLNINLLAAYKTNSGAATAYNRVYTKKPSVVDDYEMADGSYDASNVNVYTVRSPSYVAFGALQSPTTPTRVFMFRSRSLETVNPGYFTKLSDTKVYIDRVSSSFNAYDTNGTLVTDDLTSLAYVNVFNSSAPGIGLGAVVEFMYNNQSGSLAANIVDLTEATTTVTIADGYSVPLYGANVINKPGGLKFASIVKSVGNRLVLSGNGNRVLVSNSDWTYRGITWNNFQVSTIDFSETSAYLLTLTQDTSTITSIQSVNGVLVVGTDSGIYRVSGTDAVTAPNAKTASVSRVSNEVVASQSSMLVYGNKVFYVSKNGLYLLDYSRDNAEINAIPVSAKVSTYFTNYTANAISYSRFYRALLIGFADSSDILVYLIESDTFAVFKTPGQVISVIQTLDGYKSIINSTDTNPYHVLFCRWNTSDADLSNALTMLPVLSNVTPKSQTFTEVPSTNTLAVPVELLATLNTSLTQSYGKENARAVKGNVAVVEPGITNNPQPIISSFVTKAFTPVKLLSSNRVRGVNILVSGSGSGKALVVYQTQDYNDHSPSLFPFTVDATSGYSGESLLNYQSFNEQSSVGDSININVGFVGISEAWELAITWDGTLKLLGYEFNTSNKRKNRLR